MTEILNRKLTPLELQELQRNQALGKKLRAVEESYHKKIEEPARIAGWLLAVLAGALFLDITGWIAAFISPGGYAVFALVLQTVETLAVVGLAGVAIFGSINAYREQQAKQKVRAEFEMNPKPPE